MDVLKNIDELSRVANLCRLVYIATPSIKVCQIAIWIFLSYDVDIEDGCES